MDFSQYIKEATLILIPVLYIIGNMLKGLESIKDKYIPVILTVIAIGFCIAILGLNIDAVIQGILIAGTTIYTNQLVKQKNKEY